MVQVPLVTPQIGEEETMAVLEVLRSGMLAQGPRVNEFETLFAQYCGVKHAVAVNSGTAALHAAVYACGLQAGDAVITTPFTFVATANSILMQDADVVFADIQEDTLCLDPDAVRAAVREGVKAIMPVDLYGQVYDERIDAVASEHDLIVIEDAAQSMGARRGDRKAGSFGNAACFSFYATKNMLTGEGGMLTTDDPHVAEMARRLRHHGQSEQTRYEYHDLGYNYRMMDLQAAIGIAQLNRIDELNAKRRENAKRLDAGLSTVRGIRLPAVTADNHHVYHQYTIIVEEEYPLSRDELLESLRQKGIGCAVYYPKPLHLHPHFARMGFREGDFPVAERLARSVLSLPVHPSLTPEQVQTVVEAIARP